MISGHESPSRRRSAGPPLDSERPMYSERTAGSLLDLSIVVVSWNTSDLLDACLASLPASCSGLRHEVFVVDNASSDGSTAMIRERHPAVHLIESGGNLGFTRANNLALPRCRGEFVLLLNPDTVCPAGSLAALVDFARTHTDLGACGPTLVDAAGAPTITYGNEPSPFYHLLELLGPHDRRLPRFLRHYSFVRIPKADALPSRIDYVAGACLLAPRRVLEEIGLLDERFFMYFEETDWCRRARDAGYEVWHAAGIEIVHLEGRAAAKASRFSLDQFHTSFRLYVEKHNGPGRVLAFRAVLLLENLAKAFYRSLIALFGNRRDNVSLADNHWYVARLQLRSSIRAIPPTAPL